MKDRKFGVNRVGILFALGLVGALAACGGDDSSGSEGTGGAGGQADGGTGGSAGLDAGHDAANDRVDATSDAPADARDSSADAVIALDVTADRGPDVVADSSLDVRADATVDQSTDASADRGADVSLDAGSVSDASEAAALDAADAGATPDSAATPDAADAAADVVSTTDAGVTSDASDAAIALSDASDAPTFTPMQFTSWVVTGPDGGTSDLSGDAGPLTWTVDYPTFGSSVTIEGFFAAPADWTSYRTLIINARALSGADTEAEVELFLEGSGDDDGGFANTTLETNLITEGDFQVLTINVEGQPVLSQVERVGIRITAVDEDAGLPLVPTVIQIQNVMIQ
ncbi:MAG TPA: hypothetical protein VGL13_11800 [Polyangiaceae bacterium]